MKVTIHAVFTWVVMAGVSGCAGRSWIKVPADPRPISVREAITRVQDDHGEMVTVMGIVAGFSSNQRFALADGLDATQRIIVDNSAPATSKVETGGRWIKVYGVLQRKSAQIILKAQAMEIGELAPQKGQEKNHHNSPMAPAGGHRH